MSAWVTTITSTGSSPARAVLGRSRVIHDALADELAALTRTFAGSRAADPA
jgi:hypothetical protein